MGHPLASLGVWLAVADSADLRTSNNTLLSTRRLEAEGVPARSWSTTDCAAGPFSELVANASTLPKKRVLVTGAGGFIASHVAEFTVSRLGWDTVAVDDLSGGFKRNVPTGCTFVRCAITLRATQKALRLRATHV